ncbi:MAG: DNA polymerase I [Candidatus Pelagibacter sp.]|nr:DNA polymerase I [Candidatus Pelagibacter sp.]OUV86951.1 MAG: DNA polymerase I [Pelagibacteraceae bacterium TMED136]|tara:strand:+ start:1839 stop:4607 length:2769 start_codon:yes stop_codon:yes gene_type:complete
MSKEKHLFLIDGSGYIFRAYYALPPLTRKSDGLPVGAVSGFCNMLYSFLEKAKAGNSMDTPTHLAVIFDSARKNFRNEIYKEYKGNRSDAPEDLVPQFDYIRKAVKAFNLPSIELINYEADDLIATYKVEAKKKKIKVTIVSSDKDLMQLVDKDTCMLDTMKDRLIGIDQVKEKFGVLPEKVIDVQSLAGDSVDNIPGVPGIGIKTASELINKFGSLDELLKRAETIKQPKRRQALLDNKKGALISRELVTLKTNVPLKEKIDDFELKSLDKQKIFNFLDEMEFTKIKKRIEQTYGKAEKNEILIQNKNFNNRQNKKFHIIYDISELEKILDLADNQGYFSIDTETNSLNSQIAELVGISLSIRENEAFYIPLQHKNTEDKNLRKQIELKRLIKLLKPYLEDETIIKVGQNIKYDLKIFTKYGILLKNFEDTMLLSYTLDAGLNRHNLDLLAKIHLDHDNIKFKDIVGTGKSEITFDQVLIDNAYKYACEDADVTLKLYHLFKDRIVKEKCFYVYENLEIPLINVLAKMERNGIKIDEKILKNLSKSFQKDLKTLEKKIYDIAGEEFNIASTKQLGDILYEKLKISGTKKTKKGNFATNVNVLEELASKGNEFPKLVLEWRQKSKLKNTYTDSLPEFIDKKTERIHTSFLLAATNTGRLASSDPNLQNIPIKSIEGKEIRSAFVAEKGNSIISADYSQIEMRVLAHVADVKELKRAFLNNEDIHNITASQIFECNIKKISEDMRRKAKAINFGIIYGISSYGLAKQISVSNSEAENFLFSYFKKFPEIKEYMQSTLKLCRKNGYVKTMFDRKCHFPNINDKNHTLRSFQERASMNAPIQGAAADIIRFAMININKKIVEKQIDCSLLVQIHDELLFESKDSVLNKEITKIKYEMENAVDKDYGFSVPLIVDANSAKNWNDAH